MKIEELRKEPVVQDLVQLAHNAIYRIRELESELANHKKTSGSPIGDRQEAKQADRLYKAVERLAALAGEDANDTVEWLCGEYGGLARLFEAYFGQKANQVTEFCPMCEGKPAPRKPLTNEQVRVISKQYALGIAFPHGSKTTPEMFARAIEAAHGIKEEE